MLKMSYHSVTVLVTMMMVLLMATTPVVLLVQGLGDKESDLPLFESTPTHCDDMLNMHRWEGSCCSLNVTEGNGCVLNVRDGNCFVYGQVWTLNYTSTSDIPCPPSEYSNEDLGMRPPTSTGSEGDDSSGADHMNASTMAGIMAFIVTMVGAFS